MGRALLAALAMVAVFGGTLPAVDRTPRPASGDRVTLPSLSVAGAPRSLVTLAVAVPAELEGASQIRYAVEVSGRVDVLGRLEGVLTVAPGARPRPVMLTLRVPHDALVGLVDVADVVFVGDDGREFVVPIILRVPAVLAIRISGDREYVNLAGGDRLELSYRVQNLGNAMEQFDVDVIAPSEWTLRDRAPRTVVVAPYGTAELMLGMRVPPFAPGGDVLVTVALRRRGDADTAVVASARTTLRVRDPEPRAPGLSLDPTLTIASSAAGAGVGTALRLSGPIGPDLRIRAQLSPTRPSEDQRIALAAAGAYVLPFQAAIYASRWSAEVGTTQLALPELTGNFVSGHGASARVFDDRREITAIAARPRVGDGNGQVVGVAGSLTTGVGRVGGSFATLEEAAPGSLSGRKLTALGADWTSNPMSDITVDAGAAVRDFGSGATLGLRLQGVRETERDFVRARFVHTPGGARAFAVATDQFQLEARRNLTERLVLTADASTTSDAGGVFSSISGRSISGGPRYHLSPRSVLGARVMYSEISATSAVAGLGGFGTRSTGIAASVSTGFGDWNVSSDLQANAVTREATLLSGAEDRHTSPQGVLNAVLTRQLETMGQVAVGASVAQSGAGSGLPLSATSSFFRWVALPLVVAGQVIRTETEARVYAAAAGDALVSYRVGLATRFVNGLDLSASVSRSPFIRSASGRGGYLAALQLSTSTDVFSSSRLVTPGVVFIDTDGDGKQGPSEVGVQGVALRYANVRVSTDRHGEYRLPADLRGRVRVDPATLPRGFVAHPRLALDSLERRSIPLVATGTKVVELTVETDVDGRAPEVDLSLATIWLVDRDGFEWVGRSVGGGRFTFEHVPAGEYALRYNVDRLAEQVRIDDVQVSVQAGVNDPQLVAVRGRAVRLITPPRSGGRGGSSGRAGRTGTNLGGTP